MNATFGGSRPRKKSWSAPLPDKPSDRGLFGLPEDTGAAPITGAPAAHCFKLLRQDLENLAGSDQKHHGYVLVLDCTVAGGFLESLMLGENPVCKRLNENALEIFSTFVTGPPGGPRWRTKMLFRARASRCAELTPCVESPKQLLVHTPGSAKTMRYRAALNTGC